MTCLRGDARKSRRTRPGVVLAVIAAFGLIALSGGHNTVVHDDDAIHVTSIEHRHSPLSQSDPDAPILLLAQEFGGGSQPTLFAS